MNITIQNEPNYPIDESRLIQAAQAVIARHDIPSDSAVTVVITTDEDIQRLNREFRGVDKPTDVLSFPADDLPEELTEADEPPYLGDILIAYPYTRAQSEREGYDTGDSVVLMVVHGMLHVLGYDHDTPDNRAEMWDIQAEVLVALAIDPRIVGAYEEE